MLKKLCDNCKSEMNIDDNNFRIEINTSKDEIIELYADLCEKCENDLIEAIKTTLKSYGIKEEEINEDSNEQKS